LASCHSGQTLIEIQTTGAIRRLIDLGAIHVISEPTIAYGWTHDGRRMIDELKQLHPYLLQMVRTHELMGAEKGMTPIL
jgi:hypothetical protein